MVLLVGVAGKRFTGKDTLSHALQTRLEGHTSCEIGTISMPFKKHFAEKFGYDYARLMKDREYKEEKREQMIKYFHELEAAYPDIDDKWWHQLLQSCVLIAPDIRLKSDLVTLEKYAQHKILIKIHCNNETRQKLGWKLTSTVDTDKTETDLDEYTKWDYEFENNGTMDSINLHADKLAEIILEFLREKM